MYFSSYSDHQVIGQPGGQTAGKYGGKRATQTLLVNHGQPARSENMHSTNHLFLSIHFQINFHVVQL